MATIKMNTKGFDTFLKTIDRLGGNAHKAVEEALLECHELITRQVNQEMTRYKVNSGEMRDSIYKENKVTWSGETAYIHAGFNQKQSMHATYMMITGTAVLLPDMKLYNAIYGSKTKKAIKEIQEKALLKAIEEAKK